MKAPLACILLAVIGVVCAALPQPGDERERLAKPYAEVSELLVDRELAGGDVRPFVTAMRRFEDLVLSGRTDESLALLEDISTDAGRLAPSSSASPRPSFPKARSATPPSNEAGRAIFVDFYASPEARFDIARTYHVAGEAEGASNENNGLFPVHRGGKDGPFRDFNNPHVRGKLVGPSDGVRMVVHAGVYRVEDLGEGGILLDGRGDALHPVILTGAEGETAVIVPASSLRTREPILVAGEHGIVENLFIKRIGNKYNLLVVGMNSIIRNNVIEGPWFEDAIKVGAQARNCLIFNNDISAHGSQAIDSFGDDVLVLENHIHHDMSGEGMAFGTKGGTKNNVYSGNDTHHLQNAANGGGTGDLDLYARDEGGELLHAASNVAIVDNTFHDIRHLVVRFESCSDCLFEGNLILDSAGGYQVGVDPDVLAGEFASLAVGLPPARGTRIRNNRFANLTKKYVGLVEARDRDGFVSENNVYYMDEPPKFAYRDEEFRELSLQEFQSLLGTDRTSAIRPLREFQEKR